MTVHDFIGQSVKINMNKLFAAILILLLLAGCQAEWADPVQRSRDPWVLRSVLDQRPRMITLALHADGYAAYDARRCAPYKVWRGGICLDGAAYNDIKTVQPNSWGNTYWEAEEEQSVWAIERQGKRMPVTPRFRGYRLKDSRITFQYELPLPDGRTIPIFEEPEFLPGTDGAVPVFRQRFRTKEVPTGTTLIYRETILPANEKITLRNKLPAVPPPPPPDLPASANSSQYWLDRSGCNTCHAETARTTGPAYREIAARYSDDRTTVQQLARKVQKGGAGVWGEVPMTPHPHLELRDLERMVDYILSLEPEAESPLLARQSTGPGEQSPAAEARAEKKGPPPGFGAPLTGVHPSYDLSTVRPAGFRPRVGAMDFLPDGRLLVATWDSVGGVYALSNVKTGDSRRVQVKRIAAGLHEPLGMKVLDGELFVLQKQELTQLIDHDGDEVIDEYRAVCNDFGATADFHEYSYGLEYADGYFYATLGLAMRLMSKELQHPDRGTTIRIDRAGNWEKVNEGLRQPNGIGRGVDGELFITENQGQWVPACKVIHVRAGDFHGCRLHTGDRYAGREMTPPAIWLPQNEIGNSPGQPVLIPDGPYTGQMLHGEVTHGGIKRVFLEKVDGAYQGGVFRFTQGLEAGINRLAWGPDGALYAGGVGMNGNWGWGNSQYGLQRLSYNGRSTFEMLAVRARPDGLEIEFTEPLDYGYGEQPDDYTVRQWRYEPTPAYGGPKLDLETLPVSQVRWSKSRQRVRLTIPSIKEKHVLYLLLSDRIRSESGQRLWAGECWYTMNRRADEQMK